MKLARSLLFRLALTYAGLFLTSVILLLALFYCIAIWQPLERAKEGISAEVREMLELYNGHGQNRLVSALQLRALDTAPPSRFHALIDPQGETVTSNLPSWPERGDDHWLQIEADVYRNGDEEDHEALVFDLVLSDGSRLLLGRDIEDLDDVEEALWETSTWGFPSLALLVVVGSTIMSMAVTRRLDAIDRAARRVMEGSLSDRIPRTHTGDDLDSLAGTLNEMLSRIEKSMDSVRRVSDSVAHELRTPLARMHTTLVRMRASEPGQSPDMLEAVIEEAELMIRMFDAVLRISRIESRRHSIESKAVDLASIITDVVEFYEPAIEQGSVALTVEVEQPLAVKADGDLIFQALANLLDNAVKFTPSGGTIALYGRREGGDVVLTISDSGPGIPPQIRERVTERFYRGTDHSATSGFGLGLALVEAVADLHHSTLRFVDAAPGLTVRWTFSQSAEA